MSKQLETTGVPDRQDIETSPGYPSRARMARGPVAVIECFQEIPCNPCETVCPFNAITVGDPITNLPVLDGEKCNGCGSCIAICPGQAIFLVDNSGEEQGIVAFPYEYLPLPEKGDQVEVTDREGKVLGIGKVEKVIDSKKNDRTPVIYVSVAKALVEEVRGMKGVAQKGERL